MTIKLLTTPSRSGHTVLRALAPVVPFAWQSNKEVLFYFTQNSVRLNLVLGYRGWIWLHYVVRELPGSE